MNYEKLKLTEGKHWKVFLHTDHTVPGRIYFWYNEEAEDLMEAPEDAIVEFYKLGRELKTAIIKAFEPNMFNYLSLGNITKDHLHIHMIPRYSVKKEFFGYTFEDSAYGKSFHRDHKLVPDEELLLKIRDEIKKQLVLNDSFHNS